MKKTIVKISEGLGNQLFMYAHAYAFSKKMDYDLYVDASTAYKKLKIRTFLLDNMNINLKYADPEDLQDNIIKYLSFKINKNFDLFRSKKRFLIEKKYKNKKKNFNDYTKKDYSDKVYIEGYFESEKYFQDYKNDITQQFQIKDIKKNSLFKDPNIFKNNNSVSIVIRQHRFSEKIKNQENISKSNIFLKNTFDYVFKAVEIIKTKVDNPKFFIFSNDTSNLENFFDKHSFDIIHHDNYKAINDFYLSTLCKHFIVGPSTFHWWSAYLSKNLNKICIRPTDNISFSSNSDIYPDNWLKIE